VNEKVLHAPRRPDPFAGELPQLNALSRRIGADPENVQRDLGQLVLTSVELLRRLMERQALRRIGLRLPVGSAGGAARPHLHWSSTGG
jgi:hypothetical protein